MHYMHMKMCTYIKTESSERRNCHNHKAQINNDSYTDLKLTSASTFRENKNMLFQERNL